MKPILQLQLIYVLVNCSSLNYSEEREKAVSLAYMLTLDFCKERGKLLWYRKNEYDKGSSPQELHKLFLSHKRERHLPCKIAYCYQIML